LREVGGGLFGRSERLAGGIQGEGSVRNAFDVELFPAEAKKLSVNADPGTRIRICISYLA